MKQRSAPLALAALALALCAWAAWRTPAAAPAPRLASTPEPVDEPARPAAALSNVSRSVPVSRAPLGAAASPDPGPRAQADAPGAATLPADPYRIVARLVDRDGAGLAGACVTLIDLEGAPALLTDDDGALDAGSCNDARARTLQVRFSAAPRATYGDSVRVQVTPTTPLEARPDVTVPHGPRVRADVLLPAGTRAEDFVVELQHAPSLFSSQMGCLGGCGALHEGGRGLWAWPPPITNSVRGDGASARVLSLDGLWASPFVRVTTLAGEALDRRVGNDEDVLLRTSLLATGVVRVTVDAPGPAPPLTLEPSGASGPSMSSIERDPDEAPVATVDADGVQRFHWVPPGPWVARAAFGELAVEPSTERVVATAGVITEVRVTLRAR